MSLTLEIGAFAETTEVTAVTSLISTENATVGTVIENRRIVELPLNGRNYLSLIALSPNVSAGFAGAGQAGDRQGGSRANQQISISGQRREFNYYTLDGVDNTDVNFNTNIFLPSVDALEEFKVETGIYSAEFGRAAGQVNVVTKSGSNVFHGTVFEFHRNDAFDARPYVLYELPFGSSKPFAETGVPAAILGGWQISAIVNKSSGFPRDPAVGVDIPNTGAQTHRPNLVSGQDPNDGAKTTQQWFNTAAFARPDAFTYGDAGRNIVIGPGIFTTDMSILRNFNLGGFKSLQFRLEAFNLFNQPVWGDPTMSMASPLYGTINTTRTPMRELQIGVKFSF